MAKIAAILAITGKFYGFFAFTIQCRLVYLEVSFNQDSIRWNPFSRLQQNEIIRNNIGNRNFNNLSRSANTAVDTSGILLQFCKCRLAAVFR
jgi:hypothetical protein